MVDYSSQAFPNQETTVAIEFLPVQEEHNDLSTWATIEQLYIDMEQDAYQIEGLKVNPMPMGNRGVDVLLISALATGIAANKDIFINFFNTVFKIIELLIKKQRVQEIEIKIKEKSLILKDIREQDAIELLKEVRVFLDEEKPHVDSITKPANEPLATIKVGVSKHSSKK